MVASSEQQSAPVIVNKPAIAHANSNQPGAPLNRDDSAEVMKMPEPTIDPIPIMDANCFATHIDIAAFDGAHFAFTQHPWDALGSFFWIAEHCIRSRARNQPAVI